MKCIYCGIEEKENIAGEYVCSECLERNFTSCSDCGVWVHNDDICTATRDGGSEVYVCQRCRRDREYYS